MTQLRTITGFGVIILAACSDGDSQTPELTRASQSIYENDISKATTSAGLTKADLAWHAANTYGWDCAEVVSRGEVQQDGYYLIECASGVRLRVYPRKGAHPKITNESGHYD